MYDESKQENYEYLYVKVDDKTTKFNTGDPIIDWIDYLLWRKEQKDIEIVMTSSSVDHWFFDGDEYFELIFDKKYKPISHEEIMELSFDEVKKLPEFIAKKPMKTVNDLEKYYFNKTKKQIKIDMEK